MSSRLQLDVRNLSLGRRRLVNAYEVKTGIGVIAGKTVIHAWAPCVYYTKKRYINTLTFTFISDGHRTGRACSLARLQSRSS